MRLISLFFSLFLGVALSQPAVGYSEAELEQLKLTGNCVECDLSGANLKEANLVGADLSGALLRRVDLTNQDLTGVNLSGANL